MTMHKQKSMDVNGAFVNVHFANWLGGVVVRAFANSVPGRYIAG